MSTNNASANLAALRSKSATNARRNDQREADRGTRSNNPIETANAQAWPMYISRINDHRTALSKEDPVEEMTGVVVLAGTQRAAYHRLNFPANKGVLPENMREHATKKSYTCTFTEWERPTNWQPSPRWTVNGTGDEWTLFHETRGQMFVSIRKRGAVFSLDTDKAPHHVVGSDDYNANMATLELAQEVGERILFESSSCAMCALDALESGRGVKYKDRTVSNRRVLSLVPVVLTSYAGSDPAKDTGSRPGQRPQGPPKFTLRYRGPKARAQKRLDAEEMAVRGTITYIEIDAEYVAGASGINLASLLDFADRCAAFCPDCHDHEGLPHGGNPANSRITGDSLLCSGCGSQVQITEVDPETQEPYTIVMDAARMVSSPETVSDLIRKGYDCPVCGTVDVPVRIGHCSTPGCAGGYQDTTTDLTSFLATIRFVPFQTDKGVTVSLVPFEDPRNGRRIFGEPVLSTWNTVMSAGKPVLDVKGWPATVWECVKRAETVDLITNNIAFLPLSVSDQATLTGFDLARATISA